MAYQKIAHRVLLEMLFYKICLLEFLRFAASDSIMSITLFSSSDFRKSLIPTLPSSVKI